MTVQVGKLDPKREQFPARSSFRSIWAGLEHARTLGMAQAVLEVLELRQIPIPEAVREHVMHTCNDQRTRGWLARVYTVASAEELLTVDDTDAPTPEP